MAENTKKPEEISKMPIGDEGKPLDIRDLVTDERDPLAEYLSVSVSNDGENTTVSATSHGDNSQQIQTVITGMTANDLQDLIQGINPDISDPEVI